MRFVRLLALVVGIACYSTLALYVVAVLPNHLVREDDFVNVPVLSRYELVNAERDSVRSALAALFGASAFGAAGLLAVLTYRSSQRNDRLQQAQAEHSAFQLGLEQLKETTPASLVSGLGVLVSVAARRPELSNVVIDASIVLLRSRLRRDSRLDRTTSNRDVPSLSDREPVGAAALVAIGSLPPSQFAQPNAGYVLRRNCGSCDFRRLEASDLRFEVVSFVGCLFWDCRLASTTFEKCVLMYSDWLGAKLSKVRFVDCDLTGASWESVDLGETSFIGCTGGPT